MMSFATVASSTRSQLRIPKAQVSIFIVSKFPNERFKETRSDIGYLAVCAVDPGSAQFQFFAYSSKTRLGNGSNFFCLLKIRFNDKIETPQNQTPDRFTTDIWNRNEEVILP